MSIEYFPSRETQNPLNPTVVSPLCSGLRNLPSPPCKGDLGHVALFLFLSPFIFPFFLLLAPKSDGSESPPSPLPFPTFRFTSQPFDLVLYEGDLLEALGDLSLHWPFSLLSAQICHSSGRRDPLR